MSTKIVIAKYYRTVYTNKLESFSINFVIDLNFTWNRYLFPTGTNHDYLFQFKTLSEIDVQVKELLFYNSLSLWFISGSGFLPENLSPRDLWLYVRWEGSNANLPGKCNIGGIETFLIHSQLPCGGHVASLSDGRIPKVLIYTQLDMDK